MIGILFIAGLMGVGMWLESIGTKHGPFDELLTPFPLGLFGALIAMEKGWI